MEAIQNISEARLPKTTVTNKISADNWKNHFKTLHTKVRENTPFGGK